MSKSFPPKGQEKAWGQICPPPQKKKKKKVEGANFLVPTYKNSRIGHNSKFHSIRVKCHHEFFGFSSLDRETATFPGGKLSQKSTKMAKNLLSGSNSNLLLHFVHFQMHLTFTVLANLRVKDVGNDKNGGDEINRQILK